MKERPILMSAPMVRAILAGRKTQTRRLVTVPWRGSQRTLPYEPYWIDTDGVLQFCDETGDYRPWVDCVAPYGKPGERLWVKETFREVFGETRYRASIAELHGETWKPSIFMPRKLSRITLEVTDVRVQRVQDISEEDAKAEGLSPITKDGHLIKWGIPDRDGLPGTDNDGWPWQEWERDPRKAFAKLWDKINGKRAPWSESPWVWVVSFRVLP
jgi:hypothetical protein